MVRLCQQDGPDDDFMFLPTVEPAHEGAFLTEEPLELIRDGRTSPVPLMTGVCAVEGLVWVICECTLSSTTIFGAQKKTLGKRTSRNIAP